MSGFYLGVFNIHGQGFSHIFDSLIDLIIQYWHTLYLYAVLYVNTVNEKNSILSFHCMEGGWFEKHIVH